RLNIRREKVETISSHAMPSPARARLTSSAPLVSVSALSASKRFLSPAARSAFRKQQQSIKATLSTKYYEMQKQKFQLKDYFNRAVFSKEKTTMYRAR